MAKFERKIKKNLNKSKEKAKKESTLQDQILNLAKIICGILLVAIIVCVINNISNGSYSKNKNETATTDYNNITSGQTFTRSEESYYVVFYNEEDILTTIDKASINATIYKVNLNSPLNKNILSETSNITSDIETLKVKETTIIKIENGQNVYYEEGYDNVVEYLNELQ